MRALIFLIFIAVVFCEPVEDISGDRIVTGEISRMAAAFGSIGKLKVKGYNIVLNGYKESSSSGIDIFKGTATWTSNDVYVRADLLMLVRFAMFTEMSYGYTVIFSDIKNDKEYLRVGLVESEVLK